MVKAKAKAKKRPKIPQVPVPEPPPRSKPKRPWSKVQWVCVGIDAAVYGISVAGIAKTVDGKIRVATHAVRWTSEVDFYERLRQGARSEYILFDLFSALNVMPELNQVFIAIEEPISVGHIQRQEGRNIIQQCEMAGAIVGGLLRYGWKSVFQIQANQWRSLVARDLGITIHHTKWNPDKKIGKFRAKEWVKEFHPKWDGKWPDIIRSKLGMVPQPKSSKAQPLQSDDRYEALAMAQWCRENRSSLAVDK